MEKRHEAGLSRSQGRNAWAVIFRHPVRIDSNTGKPGLRVRQGLGTSDEAEANLTHFDEVKGDNLPNASAKEQHVLASVKNVLASIGEELGPFAEWAFRDRLEKARFFCGRN
ncbi:MAG: hypothetical protein LBG69_00405 [Zoogloeaceae bacterium]|jgi:hypothetical protein|nr:hypothetical protein [Zoogloeaceae bacterium]